VKDSSLQCESRWHGLWALPSRRQDSTGIDVAHCTMIGELERLQRADVIHKRDRRETQRGRGSVAVPSVEQLLHKHLLAGDEKGDGEVSHLSYIEQLDKEHERARVTSHARVPATKQAQARSKRRAFRRAATPRYMMPKKTGTKSARSSPSPSRTSSSRTARPKAGRAKKGESPTHPRRAQREPTPHEPAGTRPQIDVGKDSGVGDPLPPESRGGAKTLSRKPAAQRPLRTVDFAIGSRQHTAIGFNLSHAVGAHQQDGHAAGSGETGSFLPQASPQRRSSRPLRHVELDGLTRRSSDTTTAAAVDGSPRGNFLKALRHVKSFADKPAHVGAAHNQHLQRRTRRHSKSSFRLPAAIAATHAHADVSPGTPEEADGGFLSSKGGQYLDLCVQQQVIPEYGDIKPMLSATCSRSIFYANRQGGDKLAVAEWAGIATLDLCNNGLSDEACERVVVSLDPLHISKLDLSHNHGGVKLCRALADRLASKCRLQELNLARSRLGIMGCEYLERALIHESFAPQLTRLGLSNCDIPDAAGNGLAEALSQCKALVEVDLSWNHLRDSGAQFVQLALHSLDLSHNPLGQGPQLVSDKDRDAERKTLLEYGLFEAHPHRYATARNPENGKLDLRSVPPRSKFMVASGPEDVDALYVAVVPPGAQSAPNEATPAVSTTAPSKPKPIPPRHYAIVRSHSVARAIADALKQNHALRHLDLSACNLDEIDTAIIRYALRFGHGGLLGLHLEGNRQMPALAATTGLGVTAGLGGVRAPTTRGDSSHNPKTTNAASRHAAQHGQMVAPPVDFRQHSGNPASAAGSWLLKPMPLARTLLDWPMQQHCWVCGGWVEHTLRVELNRPAADLVELCVHFSFDGFSPRPIRRENGQIRAFTEEIHDPDDDLPPSASSTPQHSRGRTPATTPGRRSARTPTRSSQPGHRRGESTSSVKSQYKTRKKSMKVKHICYFQAVLPPSVVIFYFTQKYKASDDEAHGHGSSDGAAPGSYKVVESRWTTPTFEKVKLPETAVRLMHSSGSCVIPESTFRRARAVYKHSAVAPDFKVPTHIKTSSDDFTSQEPTAPIAPNTPQYFNVLVVHAPRTYPLTPFLPNTTSEADGNPQVPAWSLDASVFEPRRRFDSLRVANQPNALRELTLSGSPSPSPKRGRRHQRRKFAEEPFFDRRAEAGAFTTILTRSGVGELVRDLFDIARTWKNTGKAELEAALVGVTEVEEEGLDDDDDGGLTVSREPSFHSTLSEMSGLSDEENYGHAPYVPHGSFAHTKRKSMRSLFEGRTLQPAPVSSDVAGSQDVERDFNFEQLHQTANAMFDLVPWEQVEMDDFLVDVSMQSEIALVAKRLRGSFSLLREVRPFCVIAATLGQISIGLLNNSVFVLSETRYFDFFLRSTRHRGPIARPDE